MYHACSKWRLSPSRSISSRHAKHKGAAVWRIWILLVWSRYMSFTNFLVPSFQCTAKKSLSEKRGPHSSDYCITALQVWPWGQQQILNMVYSLVHFQSSPAEVRSERRGKKEAEWKSKVRVEESGFNCVRVCNWGFEPATFASHWPSEFPRSVQIYCKSSLQVRWRTLSLCHMWWIIPPFWTKSLLCSLATWRLEYL